MVTYASILAVAAGAAVGAMAADFYVAPDGDDARDGRRPTADGSSGPFSTLRRARDAARALRAAEPGRSAPIVVQVRGGTIRLDETLVLGPEDSGTATAPLVFEAEPGATPVLSGGVAVSGWQTTSGGWWKAAAPAALFPEGVSQVWMNGQRRYRPALPRDGYFYVRRGVPADGAATAFDARPGDLDPAWMAPGVEVLLFHSWSMSRLPFDSFDPAVGRVTARGTTWNPARLTRITEKTRYRMDNVRAAMGRPGDWYHDRSAGVLEYVPMAGERPESSAAVAPRLEHLVRIEGDPERARPAGHIVFRGLAFAHSAWHLPKNGYSFCQAEAVCPAGVTVIGARHVRFEGCVFRHTGGYALEFGDGCFGGEAVDCDFHDLGAGGVKIGTIRTTNPAGGCAVRNCRIAGGGRLHPAAIGVFIGHSASNVVEHNDISDFYYTAVSLGWTWNTNANPAHHNRIAFNRLHHIGQNVLSDMGGIYTLGRQPGTELVGNWIHDVSRVEYGGWGIYFDEGSSQIRAEGNLAHHTQDAPFHSHACRENLVVGNIFALGTNAAMQLSNRQRLGPMTFERNIWVARGAALAEKGREPTEIMVFQSNLYWSVAAADRVLWVEGQPPDLLRQRDPGAIVADPRFRDAEAGDFRPADGSAAPALVGAEPAWRRAGLLPRPSRALLPALPRAWPPAPIEPPALPVAVREDFEHWPPGHGWWEFIQAAASRELDAVVTEESAAGGRRSLCFRDGPGGESFMPHLYKTLTFTAGLVRAGMDLRLDPGAFAEFELRQNVARYHEGPYVKVHPDGRIESGGNTVAAAAPGQWFRAEIAVPVGPDRTGAYRLELRLPGDEEPRVFDGLPVKDTFQTVGWMGIMAHGTNRTRFFADNVLLENGPAGL